MFGSANPLFSQTACVAGFAGTYPCSNVDLQSHMTRAQLGTSSAHNDIWGWTDSNTGDEYALVGKNTGTAFVDISDPVNPIYLGSLLNHVGTSAWKDIKVFNNYAFIVNENNSGFQVFDLTQLTSVVTPPLVFTETAWFDIVGTSGNDTLYGTSLDDITTPHSGTD